MLYGLGTREIVKWTSAYRLDRDRIDPPSPTGPRYSLFVTPDVGRAMRRAEMSLILR